MVTEQTKIAVLAEKMDNMTIAFNELKAQLNMFSSKFVTQEQLTASIEPTRARVARLEKIVYGVSTFLATGIGALIYYGIQSFIFRK